MFGIHGKYNFMSTSSARTPYQRIHCFSIQSGLKIFETVRYVKIFGVNTHMSTSYFDSRYAYLELLVAKDSRQTHRFYYIHAPLDSIMINILALLFQSCAIVQYSPPFQGRNISKRENVGKVRLRNRIPFARPLLII
jgi:hypothetical protein